MNRQKPSASARSGLSPASDSRGVSRAVAIWLTVLTLLVIGSWVLLGLRMLPQTGAGAEAPGGGALAAAEAPSARVERTANGKAPWGRLICVPIAISPPLEFVPQVARSTPGKVEWHFPNMISARLSALLSEIGLSEPLRQKLLARADIDPGIEGLTIHPTREIVLGLSRQERSALYAVLAQFAENVDQRSAFQFRGESFDQWIDDCPLSPETRKLVEPLVYRYGNFLCFADLPAIEESLSSPQQRLALIKALSRESTFLVRLEVTDESSLEGLVAYWGRGGRTEDVRSLLESVWRTGKGQQIAITYLLPPFARRRIYTYDAFSQEQSRPGRNCHWTALNFFSDQPDDRFCDIKEVTRALKEDYYQVYGNLRLGDVVAFVDSQGRLIHSAVFIADDILFTKNGPSSAHPWMFMKLEDMKSYYPTRQGMHVGYFRRRDL
jgi:hypothetical protein